MALIGLLVAALGCITVGVLLASRFWLVASIVVSLSAGYLLWHGRAHHSADTADDPDAVVAVRGQVWVVDGRPSYHRGTCARIAGQPAECIALAQAVEDRFAPCPMCRPDRARLDARAS